MKAFALIPMLNGQPNVDFAATPLSGGYLLCAQAGNYGCYLLSGRAAELTAINAVAGVVGICAVSESGDVRWAELDGVVSSATRTKINSWLSARGYSTIPSGWTYKKIVLAIFQRLNTRFDLTTHDLLSVD